MSVEPREITDLQTARSCPNCDGTGDVHRADGEWLGRCKCDDLPLASWATLDISILVAHLRENTNFDAALIQQMLEFAISAATSPAAVPVQPAKADSAAVQQGREAMQQSLDAFDRMVGRKPDFVEVAIKSLRAALAATPQAPQPTERWTPEELDAAKKRADEYTDWFLGRAASLLPAQAPAVPLTEEDLLRDKARLDWLLPNLHPANFGLDYDAELLDRDDAGFLAAWRAAIDAASGEGSQAVEGAWNRFNAVISDGADAPYPGMAQAFETHFSQSWRDKDWRRETGVWAASWKAAIAHGIGSASTSEPAPQEDRKLLEQAEEAIDLFMEWALKNVAKWNFPQYDIASKARAALRGRLYGEQGK